MKQMIREQRHLLLKRLDVLSGKLKTESDSLRAEAILQEMRNVGELLKELVNNPVQDHPFIHNVDFKIHGKDGYLSKQAN
ncbi:MAG: hypothetical protein ABS944_16225 [Solibacillus sp.]|uniref:hypothetical protein n=1 Tax=Solibacillus sp. TaxID=1909654 RepID=UPI0033147B3A